MARGGARPGAGRKARTPNKRKAEVAWKAAEGGMLPIEYLLKVMRNSRQSVTVRMQAARDAAPYLHPRLATVDIDLSGLTEDELQEAAGGQARGLR